MREPVQIVEIDLDYCTRTFGVGVCTAALGGHVLRKCYNTWNTCRLTSAYNKGVNTLRFIQPSASMPLGQNYIPALVSASERGGQVNIAGTDETLSSIGMRATVSAKFLDFTDGDRLTDKYWSERMSGAAQIDEPGYNPKDRLTFWAKLKARNPNYSDRPMRIIDGYLDGGILTVTSTRHYVITEIDGPDSSGNVTVEAKDILSLADDEKAVAPISSNGFLIADINDTATSITLLPAGVGADYASSGWAVIGSEIVSFDRTGDVMTIGRGRRGTVASSHSVNDTVQQTFSKRLARVDDAIYDLLVNYARVNAAFIPVAEWEEEVSRWAPTLKLTCDICKPEGVAKLIGELAILGITIWWDAEAQLIRLKINRPPDQDTIYDLSDDYSIISISQEDRNKDRLSRVSFHSVQIDPTKGANKDNFLRNRVVIDVNSENANNYNGQKLKEIFCRWINHGDDSTVRVLSKRFLNRFNKQPVRYSVDVDYKDNLELVSVARLNSRTSADESGKPANSLMQVIKREELKSGHKVRLTLQKFQFDQRYSYITENTRPTYTASSAAQKARGCYIVGNTLVFGDGTWPYLMI